MNRQNKATYSIRRVSAASDGAALAYRRHVAAAGGRFPPGGPRRPRFPGDPAIGAVAIGPGGRR